MMMNSPPWIYMGDNFETMSGWCWDKIGWLSVLRHVGNRYDVCQKCGVVFGVDRNLFQTFHRFTWSNSWDTIT